MASRILLMLTISVPTRRGKGKGRGGMVDCMLIDRRRVVGLVGTHDERRSRSIFTQIRCGFCTRRRWVGLLRGARSKLHDGNDNDRMQRNWLMYACKIAALQRLQMMSSHAPPTKHIPYTPDPTRHRTPSTTLLSHIAQQRIF